MDCTKLDSSKQHTGDIGFAKSFIRVLYCSSDLARVYSTVLYIRMIDLVES